MEPQNPHPTEAAYLRQQEDLDLQARRAERLELIDEWDALVPLRREEGVRGRNRVVSPAQAPAERKIP